MNLFIVRHLSVVCCFLFVVVACEGERPTRVPPVGSADAGVAIDASRADASVAVDSGVDVGDAGMDAMDAGAEDGGLSPPREVAFAAGTFTMGSPIDQYDEREVTLTRGFFMHETEVTQAEWSRFFASNPSVTTGDDLPVDRMSWYDALAYANALSTAYGFETCYDLSDCAGSPGQSDYLCDDRRTFDLDCEGYRLPTEAEWEYAARRAPNVNAVCDGDVDPNQSVTDCRRDGFTTHPVRFRDPDGSGLHGMTGNVAEWVWDWFFEYRRGPETDPINRMGTLRATRGGSWHFHNAQCRLGSRSSRYPSCRASGGGFRLVRTAP